MVGSFESGILQQEVVALRRWQFFLCALILVSAMMVAAAPVRDHVIVPKDYFSLVYAGSPAVSPDAGRVAWIQSGWEGPGGGRMSELWLTDIDTRRSRRLTFDLTRPGEPVWSADGKWIYFSGRWDREEDAPPYDGSHQVWRVRPDGSGLFAVTRIDDGVGHFELDRNGHKLYYTVGVENHDDGWKDLKQKWGDLEYGHGVVEFDQVRCLDMNSWRDELILDATRVINFMSLSADGAKLAMQTTPDEETIFNEGWSRIDVLTLASGAIEQITDPAWRESHPSPFGWITQMDWAHDGKALAFAISFDGFASQIWVADWRDDGVPLQRVTLPHPLTLDGSIAWRGKGRALTYLGEDRGRIRVQQVDGLRGGGQGKTRELTGGDVVCTDYDFDDDGKICMVAADFLDNTGDLYNLEKGSLTALTEVNPQMKTWILPQILDYTWTGGDGDEVHGILELPASYDRATDGPLPTIIELHGGPTSSTKYRFRLWIYGRALLAANGYAMLSPNYHGSLGYGDEFLAKLIDRENEIEVTDIITGTEKMIADGLADPDKIGVMGWSNGGYLTNCAIVARPDLYKAASSGAGVLDMVIQWGVEDTPGHVINFMQGLPWERPEHYQAGSPLYGLDKVTTPTLIHVGGADPRVPPAHSRALYRALYHYLDVPVELVVYPDEGHGLSTYENRLAKMEWDLAWFEMYLLDVLNGDGQ
jgi:dipeptidyl aminopeptidase/acylaminoacyl peptidase